ncbi:MAG: hypothetical protein LBG63_00495 [Candidatus Methanoplasma sp.]|jgi:hypothetical protein|nr:hypothetical protein [Candidatus Methanoplasma sp.]
MLRRRDLLVSVALVALIGMLAVVSFSDDSADGSDFSITSGQLDLAAALEGAVSGDVFILDRDSTLSGDATIISGVVVDDGGYSFIVPAEVTLLIKGEFISTGDLTVESRGSIVVSSGGLLSMDNDKDTNEAVVAGSLEINKGGTFNLGLNQESIFECLGRGVLRVDGVMVVGSSAWNSTVNIMKGTVTGELQISSGSVFKIFDSLDIGNPPEFLTDVNNDAEITGIITIDRDAGAYVLVYGQSSFDLSNIKYPAVWTKFTITGKEYATEYKDDTGKRTLVFPVTTSLKDVHVTEWKDAAGIAVNKDSNLQIGSTDVYGSAEKTVYRIVFTEDKSIRWVVGSIELGSSGVVDDAAYGTMRIISVTPASGYTGVPDIFKDGEPFKRGDTLTVTGDATFTTSNHYLEPSKSKVPGLAIVAVIALILLGILVATLIIKNKKAEAK